MQEKEMIPARNILLVDDDEDDYLLTRSLIDEIQSGDYKLNWVPSYDAALGYIRDEQPDVVLVDYQLGEQNGLDLIRDAIRSGYQIPFILLTGYGTYEIDLEALHAGATDFLVKAEINAPLLERSIRYAIEHKRTEEALRRAQDELEERVHERTLELMHTNKELRDEIGERLRAEQALRDRESQLRYQALLLENVNDAIVATNQDLITTGWNRTAEEIFGWKAEEILGEPINEYLKIDTLDHTPKDVFRILKETGHYFGESKVSRKDGQRIFVELKVTTLYDENERLTGYVSINRDITEQKQFQAELAELQRRINDSIERERLELAQDLHDGPMQDIYSIIFQGQSLKSNPLPDEALRSIDTIMHELQEVNHVLRSIAGELRPPALAPFGLEKAIRSHADDFQKAHPELEIHLDLMPDHRLLPERLRLALFRIYQQGITNVVRHAHANRVDIRLYLDAESVTLEIQDDGCGFDVPSRWIKFARQGHMGLVGTAERVEAIGGVLHVKSKPGQGTLLQVQVNISEENGNGIEKSR